MSTVDQCPISGQKVGETVVRLTAGAVFVIGLFLLFTPSAWVPGLLGLDFFDRALLGGRISPIRRWSTWTLRVLKLPNRQVDAAPKLFAARIGLAMALTITILTLTGFFTTAKVLSAILVACAGLEAFLGICVGCKMYSLWIRFTPTRRVAPSR